MSSTGRGKRKLMKDDGWEERGGYMAAKIQKLQEQVQDEQSTKVESSILKGVAIFVNGYTKPSAFELKQLAIKHGGVFHHYYSREKVTHIIASNLPNSKVANLTDKKVCKPEWITESVGAGQLLPYQNYLLYTARSKIQPGIGFKTNITHTSAASNLVDSATLQVSEEDGKNQDFDDEPNSDLDNGEHDIPAENYEKSCEQAHVKIDGLLDSSSVKNGKISPDNATGVQESAAPKSQNTEPKSSKSRSPAKAGDPSFISEFYSNSRLHHLSTWGAEFKAYVTKLQQQVGDGYPARDKLRGSRSAERVPGSKLSLNRGRDSKAQLQRVIMHIDMDCFFVSVGLRNRPELVGKPIAVTHSRGKGAATDRSAMSLAYETAHYKQKRNQTANKKSTETEDFAEDASEEDAGTAQVADDSPLPPAEKVFHSLAEIASCSYEARAMGVKNGMFMGTAKKLCPDIVAIPYDFEGYNEVSRILYDTVASYTHDIEAVSCDEMLVDCTDLMADTGASPEEFARLLREEIKEKTKCNASAGMGPNILIARLATRVAKPNGQHYVQPEDVEEFIKDKPIKDLPGVGWSMTKKLQLLGVSTCGELQSLPLDRLQKELGPKTGQSLYNSCRGLDHRPIAMEKERKSVSAEINYGIRFTKIDEADKFVTSLADEVHNRMEKIGAKGKTITFKVKVRKKGAPIETAKFLGHGVCDNVAKSVTLPMATDNPKVIARETLGIMHALRIPPEDFRGIGIQVSRLETGTGQQKGYKNTPSILQFTTTKPKVDQSVVGKLPKPTSPNKPGPTEDKSLSSHSSPVKNEQADEIPSDEEDVSAGIEEETIQEDDLADFRIPPRASPRLPPLPTLPDLSSPETSFSELMTRNARSSTAGARTWKTTISQDQTHTEDLMLPSPSQIDPKVLQELPPEIRLQIKSALQKKTSNKACDVESGASISMAKVDDENVHTSQEAGCSHWSRPTVGFLGSAQSDALNVASHDPQENIEALPSYSQIDPSCLAALPLDVREELEKAYANQSKNNNDKDNDNLSAAIHPLMRLQNSPKKASPKKSPSKSPSRAKRSSPLFKVPRGRPPGKKKRLSPKKLEFARQPRIDRINQPDLGAHKAPAVQVKPEKTTSESTTTPEGIPVNLCGAVTLAEVKNLMKEWVTSSEDPEEDDLAQFVTYLADLIQDRNLEMVDLLIKYLNRLLCKKWTDGWENGASFVIHQIQTLMKCTYGSVLSVPDVWRNILM